MTSLMLMMVVLMAPVSPVHKAVTELEQGHAARADILAQRYLKSPGVLPSDDDIITAELVSTFARLRSEGGQEALAALDTLEKTNVALGPQGIALRAHIECRMDACQAALREAKCLPQGSLWALDVWGDIATCMLHHNPTLPVVSPMPQGVHEVLEALTSHARSSQSPQDAAHGLLLAGRLASAWGDAPGADALFAQVTANYSSLTDGQRARSQRLALRRQGRLEGTLTASGSEANPEALRRLLQSRTERQSLRKDALRRLSRARSLAAPAAQSALMLARIDMVEHQYQAARKRLTKLSAVPNAKPVDPELQAAAACLLGDVQSLQGDSQAALRSWSGATSASLTSPYGTLAALHAAGAKWLHGDAAGAASALAIAQARLPLTADVLVVRDDGAATVVTTAVAREEARRLSALIAPCETQPSVLATAAALSAPVAGAGLRMPMSATGRPRLSAPDLAAVELLIDHGLLHEARGLMRTLPAQDLNNTERLVAAYLYAQLGDNFRAMLLMQHCNAQCRALDPAAVAMAYPRPWSHEVAVYSRKAHVPEALVFAIMREESGFNPAIVSARGAAGLMQLMPKTAVQLARQAHVTVHQHQDLLQPDVSIALGAQLLGQLYRHFQGNIGAVAAAYQAGQPKAQQWLNVARAQGQQNDVARVIPLASTRTYVAHITESVAQYQASLNS